MKFCSMCPHAMIKVLGAANPLGEREVYLVCECCDRGTFCPVKEKAK